VLTDFEIVIDPDSLRVRTSTTGTIYVRAGSIFFPEIGWNDFPLVILGWWTAALIRLLEGQSDQEEWEFMDGPYLVRLTGNAEGRAKLAFVRGDGVNPAGIADCTIDDLTDTLIKAAREVHDLCGENGSRASDVATLEQGLEALESLRRSPRT